MIKLALNQKSCKNLTLKEFIKFSKNFKGVELNFKKIKETITKNVNLKSILETLAIYDLKVSSIFRLKDFSLCSEREYKTKVLSNLKLMMNYCYKLETGLLIVNPSFLEAPDDLNPIPKWRVLNRTGKRLKQISKIAITNDINIGFEFLSDSSISTLEDAIEIFKPLESQENLGYVIDSFHIAKSKSNYSQLSEIKQLLFLIQLGDLKHENNNSTDDLTALKDVKRVFPGEGNFDIKKFLNFIQKLNYHKEYSIELAKSECKENLYKKFYKIFTIK